jgi:cell division protein FtsZ
MGKFRRDVEVKWGLATDSSLGPKVKITLLATGFGLQSINGLNGGNQEDKKNSATEEEQEKEQNRIDQIETLYGSSKNTGRHRHNNIFIFTEENFDNDDIISRVDAKPTCERTKEELKMIKDEFSE